MNPFPHISEFFNDLPKPSKFYEKALIFGKGPSFDPSKIGLKEFFTVCINETGLHGLANVNFYIDLECMPKNPMQLKNKTVFTPIKPHQKHAPIEKPLKTYIGGINWFCFDLARPTGMDIDKPKRESNEYPDHEPLMAISNSFEAIFHMLCIYGFKEIHSIGIDGGTEYHPLFKTQEKPKSFNPNLTQFETVAKQAQKYGAKYVKL